MAATLVAVSLLLQKLSHSSRCREQDPGSLEGPRAEVDRQNAVDATGPVEFDGHSDLKPEPHPPAVEDLAQDQGDKTNRGSEVLGVEAAVKPRGALGWPHKPMRCRFKAVEHITIVVAVMAIVAVVFFAVAFQKQARKLAAEVTKSETAMEDLRKQIRADQRPWIGLTEATIQPLRRTGGGFAIKLQNTGKTPAVDLHISAAVRVEDIGQAADQQATNPASDDSAGTLMPGAAYTTDVWFKTSPDVIPRLARNELRVVTFVSVTYKDGHEGLHATKICFYWNSSMSRVKLCDGYNEVI